MQNPSSKPPPPPWVIPVVILFIDLTAIAVLSAYGVLAKLPPLAQFYYGAMTFAVPIFIYLFLKKRQRRGDD